MRERVQRQFAERTFDVKKSNPQLLTKNINETIIGKIPIFKLHSNYSNPVESKVELDDTQQKYIIVSEKELHKQAEHVQDTSPQQNFESCNIPFQSFVKPNPVPESKILSLHGTMMIPQGEFNGINLKKVTEETQVHITEPTPKNNSVNFLHLPYKKEEPIEIASQIPSLDEADFSDPDPDSQSHTEPATISNIIENLPAKEEESSDEDAGTDSENNSDLNNSLEVPIENMTPDFEDLNECDQITKYIKVIHSFYSLNSKINPPLGKAFSK